ATYGLNTDVVESVNVHEDIKLGLSSRDRYIENYRRTIEKLGKIGVKVVCYNFMPIFDWFRTDLHKKAIDGSTSLFFDKNLVAQMDPKATVSKIFVDPTLTMPGWEPARLKNLNRLFQAYEHVTEEDLWRHITYFLEHVIPVAEATGITMAIHPDDPPWSIFDLPRIITNRDNIRRFLNIMDGPCHGLTLCSGSLGADPANNVPLLVREFADRIPFAHIRNVKVFENGDFMETSHRTSDGSVNIYGVVKAFHLSGFTGYVRPDHGRQIWDEECRPGYGLYDRALGIMYIWGIWDALERARQEATHVTH
ncbi:MAG: mannonate dehydratase, partial [Firmicutes bacterium]|nr:mannonate dehydratase [Bacillota bacterium]